MKTIQGALVIMKIIKHDGLYELQGETIMDVVAKMSVELWHMHLGCIGERSLKVTSGLLCGEHNWSTSI